MYARVKHDREAMFNPEVDVGKSNADLKSFILFRELWTKPSEHIFEYVLLSVGLIVQWCTLRSETIFGN